MTAFPKFWQAGAGAFLALWLACIPARADTRIWEYRTGNNPFCSDTSGRDANAQTCEQICGPQQCTPEHMNYSPQHIIRTPKFPAPAARPDRSRPAYSRKSNRTQRA